jgi:hypothetical protein
MSVEQKIRQRIRQHKASDPATDRPFSIFTARQQHANCLTALRNSAPEAFKFLFESAVIFTARAFAAKVLDQTENNLVAELAEVGERCLPPEAVKEILGTAWVKGKPNPLKIIDWRDSFHVGTELESGDVKLYISSILSEGITFIGSLAGVGKTFMALSMAKALRSGKAFVGVFDVPEIVPVLYLVPEMGQRAFRKRLEKFGLVDDEGFRCQTISDGVCRLDDPRLEAAVKELQPVVFLDTAVRFNPAEDENASRQNAALLASDLFRLIQWGARSVVCLHHSPKLAAEADYMTLENVLRGTGDMGAMCDAVWGLQHDRRKNGRKWDVEYLKESQQQTRLYVECVKSRDFDPALPFRVQGRPHIDEKGDLVILTEKPNAFGQSDKARLADLISKNLESSPRKLREMFGGREATILKLATEAGWEWTGQTWQFDPQRNLVVFRPKNK